MIVFGFFLSGLLFFTGIFAGGGFRQCGDNRFAWNVRLTQRVSFSVFIRGVDTECVLAAITGIATASIGVCVIGRRVSGKEDLAPEGNGSRQHFLATQRQWHIPAPHGVTTAPLGQCRERNSRKFYRGDIQADRIFDQEVVVRHGLFQWRCTVTTANTDQNIAVVVKVVVGDVLISLALLVVVRDIRDIRVIKETTIITFGVAG